MSSEDANEAEVEIHDDELEEAYEVKHRAKDQAKKAFKNYRDSRGRVREIRRDRQPHMPVVALAPEGAAGQEAQPARPTFRYDKKDGRCGGDKEAEKKKHERWPKGADGCHHRVLPT